MKVTDGAARGRAAALEVRRRNKQERQAVVRELEERGVPRMKMRAELEQRGFPCSQGTLWNDLQELGAGERRPRKHRKPGPRQCEECGEWFTPKDASQDVRGYGRLCSERCRRRRGGRRAATARHRRADQELERLNAAGLLTLRQAAHEVKCVESSLCRYVELGYVEAAGRRSVEGEQWTLVRREEVRRFKAEDWPAIRARHAEMRREDLERGWPTLPSTWGGRARQRHLGRANATKPPAPGGEPRGRPTGDLTDAQRAEVAKLHSIGWGRRAIMHRTGLGQRAVRNVLEELR